MLDVLLFTALLPYRPTVFRPPDVSSPRQPKAPNAAGTLEAGASAYVILLKSSRAFVSSIDIGVPR